MRKVCIFSFLDLFIDVLFRALIIFGGRFNVLKAHSIARL